MCFHIFLFYFKCPSYFYENSYISYIHISLETRGKKWNSDKNKSTTTYCIIAWWWNYVLKSFAEINFFVVICFYLNSVGETYSKSEIFYWMLLLCSYHYILCYYAIYLCSFISSIIFLSKGWFKKIIW